jgi:hypothetical protein
VIITKDMARRVHAALPRVRNWIDAYLDLHAGRARAVSSLGFPRLATCFPRRILERTATVTVDHVTFPPVDQFGLPELALMQELPLAGITYKDTCFLRRDLLEEALLFHELVHVVQWEKLGANHFLLAYGLGLLQSGYRDCALERTAHRLQGEFESDALPENVVRVVEDEADGAWSRARDLLHG